MNNFIHQNKLDSVSAFCLKKMDLEILRNAFKKGCNNHVSTFLKTLLWKAKCCYGNCLWRVLYIHDRCSQEAAFNLHMGIKTYFPEYLSHFVKKRPKWWSISILILYQILVPAPLSVSGLLSFTNRSVSRMCYRWFRSRRRIFLKFTKLSTAQDEESPKVLFYV